VPLANVNPLGAWIVRVAKLPAGTVEPFADAVSQAPPEVVVGVGMENVTVLPLLLFRVI